MNFPVTHFPPSCYFLCIIDPNILSDLCLDAINKYPRINRRDHDTQVCEISIIIILLHVGVSRKRVGKYVAAEGLILVNQLVMKHVFHGYKN
jgi:hypothetical protein